MIKLSCAVALFATSLLTSTNATAQAHLGTPNQNAPLHQIMVAPKAVQKAFQEEVNLSGLALLNNPVWTRQNGLYSVSCRANGMFGEGTCTMRFKPYGGLVLFDFAADNPEEMPTDEE